MHRSLTPLDKIRDSIEAQRASVREELRAYLGQMDPYAFEKLVRDLLQRMDFTQCEVTPPKRDGGIDVKANFSIGISEIKTIGQVKRQKVSVSTEALQQFYGVMKAEEQRSEVHLGLYITTSAFTSSAIKWVRDSALPLVLIDGTKLVDLMVEHGLLVREAPLPAPLELDLGETAGGTCPDPSGAADADLPPSLEPPLPAPETAPNTQRTRQFRWGLELDETSGDFTLTIRYLPDPGWVRTVTGTRVPVDQNFRTARGELHAQIVELIAPLFPGLDKNLLNAKGWSGAHKVYPSGVYGG